MAFTPQSLPATVSQPPTMPLVFVVFSATMPGSATFITAPEFRVTAPSRRVEEPPSRETVVRPAASVVEPTASVWLPPASVNAAPVSVRAAVSESLLVSDVV